MTTLSCSYSGTLATALAFTTTPTSLESESVGSTPQEFDAFIRRELAKWAQVAKQTGMKAD